MTSQQTANSCRSMSAPGVEMIKVECQTSNRIVVENVGILLGSVCFVLKTLLNMAFESYAML